MTFYQLLQLDPLPFKKLIQEANSRQEKRRYIFAFILKNILVVLFAIVFIGGANLIFGNENSSVAVVVFCILLMVRFVDFGYEIKSSLFSLFLVFFILTVGPILANSANPYWKLLIHMISISLLMVLTCLRPSYGNQSIYVFGYLLIQNYPVTGRLLQMRCLEIGIGFVLCGIIFYCKHHKKHYETHLGNVFKNFSLFDPTYQWQIKVALGVSLAMFIGDLVHVPRTMWIGFAALAVLQIDPKSVKQRLKLRAPSAIVGSLVFGVICTIFPQILSMLGPISGLLMGFCATYQWKNAFNCFGALLVASSIFGLWDSIFLRILLNIFGSYFAFGFHLLYDKIMMLFSQTRKKQLISQ